MMACIHALSLSAEIIVTSALKLCLLFAFAVALSLLLYDLFNEISHRINHFIARQLGYFRTPEGKSMKYLTTNTRTTRFSEGHEVSKQGVALADPDPYITWCDGRPEVVLYRPEHVKDFYDRKTGAHEKAPQLDMGPYFARVLGCSAGVLNGCRWKSIRKVFDPHLSHSVGVDFRSTFAREVDAWVAALPSTWTDVRTGDIVVDASPACKVLPFKLIALLLYKDALSEDMFAELLEIAALHEKVMFRAIFGRKERSTAFSLLPSESKQAMDELERWWKDWNLKMIESAKKNTLVCPIADMYASVLDKTVSERDFLHTIDEILFANIDVTSAVLAFLLVNLARNEEAQRDLRNEILAHSNNFESYVLMTHTLLEYTCLESTRLCSATWFSFPEHATSPMRISNYSLPAKTPCIIDWWRLNTQAPVWSTAEYSGTTFYPRRFETLSAIDYRWSFLRFGLGNRKCIGKNISSVLMKSFLVRVLKEYALLTTCEGKGKKEGMAKFKSDRFTIMPDMKVKLAPVGA